MRLQGPAARDQEEDGVTLSVLAKATFVRVKQTSSSLPPDLVFGCSALEVEIFESLTNSAIALSDDSISRLKSGCSGAVKKLT